MNGSHGLQVVSTKNGVSKSKAWEGDVILRRLPSIDPGKASCCPTLVSMNPAVAVLEGYISSKEVTLVVSTIYMP